MQNLKAISQIVPEICSGHKKRTKKKLVVDELACARTSTQHRRYKNVHSAQLSNIETRYYMLNIRYKPARLKLQEHYT